MTKAATPDAPESSATDSGWRSLLTTEGRAARSFRFRVGAAFAVIIALHLGVITAALAYALYLAGLRTTNTSTAVTLTLVEPLAAASWGIFLLGEPMTVSSVAGILAMLASTALLALKGDTDKEK